MSYLHIFVKKIQIITCLYALTVLFSTAVIAQESGNLTGGKTLYNEIKAFNLNGGKADVSNLTLKRDRVEMTFNGTFYFTAPIGGKVTGAVFIGQGNFQAEVPLNEFEKNNVKRLLNAETVESDFKTAVLRFTDDTFDVIGKNKADGTANAETQKLAAELDSRFLKETGANLSARVAMSLINKENPGFFFANFDGGKRERFSYVLDQQNRIPTNFFGINGGEKGLILAYRSSVYDNDIWMAFYSLSDYQRQRVDYSDVNDLVDVTHYKMDLDLRAPKRKLGLKTKVSMTARFSGIRAIPFSVGESLGEAEDVRLKKQLRLKNASLGTETLEFTQEDWEGGVTLYLSKPLQAGQKIDIDFELEGDFVQQPRFFENCHYPRSTTDWYPRHGYLDRATFEMSFSHPKNLKIATNGVRQSEDIAADEKDTMITKYKMEHPVALITFAMAQFKRYTDEIKWDSGEKPTVLEYNSLTEIPIKEDFIMAELNNSVRNFHALFGKYPYDTYGAAFHPFGFGQGFPSMLMIPDTDRSNKETFAFIAHETAHQWWGNIVAWRSYRDQWLSEGFAEYSGVIYTGRRKDYKAAIHLIDEMRDSLKNPPITNTGIGKGKLYEVGPLILGHRLDTSKTYGAYSTLIYNKGALVLRMLHFLFTDPNSGNGDPFYAMMKDFVERHRNGFASTDDFMRVANEHFVKTPIAQKYGLKDLNWFFRQWVYETALPSYTMTYTLQDQPDGSCVFSGTMTQENAPENWAMVLPVTITFGEDKMARTIVAAVGPKTPFNIKLPRRPQKVELDPQKWVLSEKTKTN